MKTHFVLDTYKDELAQANFKRFYFDNPSLTTQAPNSYINVSDYSYLKSIHSKYPFFNTEISLFCVEGHKSLANKWPIHIDAGRRSALNIPIVNCGIHSTTSFYDQPNPFRNRLEPIPQYQIAMVHGDLKLIDEFSLTSPTIIDTSIPHSVINNGSGYRVIMSWGSMLNFNELVNLLISRRPA